MAEWWDKEPLMKLESPTSFMICGPSNSGKTYFLKRLLENASNMFKRSPSHILYCYGSVWQPLFSEMKHTIGNIIFHKGLPKEEELLELSSEQSFFICVLDDLMLEASANPVVERIFTKGSHHLDMTVIFLVQNIFEKGKYFRTISLNTKYFILFRNSRDKQQIQTFGRQVFPNNAKYFLDAYTKATSFHYGYLLVDLSNKVELKNCRLVDIKDKEVEQVNARLRTKIFPGESTIIFVHDEV